MMTGLVFSGQHMYVNIELRKYFKGKLNLELFSLSTFSSEFLSFAYFILIHYLLTENVEQDQTLHDILNTSFLPWHSGGIVKLFAHFVILPYTNWDIYWNILHNSRMLKWLSAFSIIREAQNTCIRYASHFILVELE